MDWSKLYLYVTCLTRVRLLSVEKIELMGASRAPLTMMISERIATDASVLSNESATPLQSRRGIRSTL